MNNNVFWDVTPYSLVEVYHSYTVDMGGRKMISETSADFTQTVWYYISDDSILQLFMVTPVRIF
jgi:hypothetical protein